VTDRPWNDRLVHYRQARDKSDKRRETNNGECLDLHLFCIYESIILTREVPEIEAQSAKTARRRAVISVERQIGQAEAFLCLLLLEILMIREPSLL